jgi:hypothetical protein
MEGADHWLAGIGPYLGQRVFADRGKSSIILTDDESLARRSE